MDKNIKKIKIASLFASIKIGGGVERVQANLSLVLDRLGYDFLHILMNDEGPRCDFAGEILNLNIPFVVGFGPKKIWHLFWLAKKVARICKDNSIDLLIGQGDFFFMVAGLSKIFGNKAKIISVVHTSIGSWSSFVKFAMLRFLHMADYIVLISEKEERTFIEEYGFESKKLSLIENAVDSKNIIALAQEEIESEYMHIFNNNKKTFINVARLNYQKNQELLIKAFAKIENKDTQLIIIGDGDQRDSLTKLTKDLGLSDRIYILGNQANPYKFVKNSDYRILTSRFEGFPVAMIEAGVLSKPILAIDCPTGPREFLDPKGKIKTIDKFAIADNGILIDFSESEHAYIFQAMNYALGHDLSHLSKNASIYCQRYDLSKYGIKWQKVITSL